MQPNAPTPSQNLMWQGRPLASSSAFLSPSERWPLIQAELSEQAHMADVWSNAGSEKPPSMAEVRTLQAFASRSAVGWCKIAFVHNAQHLSAETANALLKLVEEPPPGFYTVLLAAADTFLPTLRSRLTPVSYGVPVAEGAATQWAAVLSGLELSDPASRRLATQLLFWYPSVHAGVRSGTVLDAF